VDVAVLGTGRMGGAMARRLAARGHALHLWNRSAVRARDLGVGVVHDTAAAAAGAAEVVLSVLTGPEAVRQVYLGRDGVLTAAGDRVLVEMSTTGPDVHAELAAACAELGTGFLESPVLGSVDAAGSGKLILLVGGEDAALARARPVLEDLGEARPVGPVGTGSRLKLVANAYLGVTHAAAAELLVAALDDGLDPEAVWPLLVRLVPSLDARRHGFLERRYEPVTFRVADAHKDLRLALELFRHSGSATPLTARAEELFGEAELRHGDVDLPAVAEVFRLR